MIYDGWLKPHTPAHNLFTINSLIAMAGLTAAGFGVSCLPRDYFADMVNTRQLVIARTSVAPPQSVYCAMYRRDADAAFCQNVAELAESCCNFSVKPRSAMRFRACLRTGGAGSVASRSVAPVSCEVAWHGKVRQGIERPAAPPGLRAQRLLNRVARLVRQLQPRRQAAVRVAGRQRRQEHDFDGQAGGAHDAPQIGDQAFVADEGGEALRWPCCRKRKATGWISTAAARAGSNRLA